MSPEWNLQESERVSEGPVPWKMRETSESEDALEQLAVGVEDDDGHVGRAQDAELVRFFEEAVLALEERDLAVAVVLDGRDRDLAATHVGEREERGELMRRRGRD